MMVFIMILLVMSSFFLIYLGMECIDNTKCRYKKLDDKTLQDANVYTLDMTMGTTGIVLGSIWLLLMVAFIFKSVFSV